MGEAACLIPVDIEGEIYLISVQCMIYIAHPSVNSFEIVLGSI